MEKAVEGGNGEGAEVYGSGLTRLLVEPDSGITLPMCPLPEAGSFFPCHANLELGLGLSFISPPKQTPQSRGTYQAHLTESSEGRKEEATLYAPYEVLLSLP